MVMGWTSQLQDIYKAMIDVGIYYSDFNLSNIILRPNGKLTLVDFEYYYHANE